MDILLHGWNNTIQSYLVLSAGFLSNPIFALLPWAVAIYLLKKYGARPCAPKSPQHRLNQAPPEAETPSPAPWSGGHR